MGRTRRGKGRPPSRERATPERSRGRVSSIIWADHSSGYTGSHGQCWYSVGCPHIRPAYEETRCMSRFSSGAGHGFDNTRVAAGTAIVPNIRAHVPRRRGGLQNRVWWVRFPTVRARCMAPQAKGSERAFSVRCAKAAGRYYVIG